LLTSDASPWSLSAALLRRWPFAGLNGAPGEFQFNVVIPSFLASGDQEIVATYNGFTTQPGVLISVQ
jgi:uncharacterized protein (TIGR03437 family)